MALKSYQHAIRVQVHWITCIGIRLLYTSCKKDVLPCVKKKKESNRWWNVFINVPDFENKFEFHEVLF